MFKRVMMLGLMMLGLVGISVVAMLGTEANAATCTVTNPCKVCVCGGGSACCFYKTSSVKCHETADNVPGNVNANDKFLVCSIAPPSGETTIPVVVFCKNGGNNVALGSNTPIELPQGIVSIDEFLQLTSANTKKGFASVDITVQFTQFFAQTDALCAAEINPNWTTASVVPCAFTATDKLVDDPDGIDVIEALPFQCKLEVTQCDPSATETLDWDKKRNRPEEIFYVDANDPTKLCGR